MKLLVDGNQRDGGLLRTESRRLDEVMLRREWAEPDAASRGPRKSKSRPPAASRGATMSPPWTSGGGKSGSAAGSMELVPEREKYNGRDDQGTELASQGVVEMDRDGSEQR